MKLKLGSLGSLIGGILGKLELVKFHIATTESSLQVGDVDVMPIPDAETMNTFVVKGKGGTRYRMIGIQYRRES